MLHIKQKILLFYRHWGFALSQSHYKPLSEAFNFVMKTKKCFIHTRQAALLQRHKATTSLGFFLHRVQSFECSPFQRAFVCLNSAEAWRGLSTLYHIYPQENSYVSTWSVAVMIWPLTSGTHKAVTAALPDMRPPHTFNEYICVVVMQMHLVHVGFVSAGMSVSALCPSVLKASSSVLPVTQRRCISSNWSNRKQSMRTHKCTHKTKWDSSAISADCCRNFSLSSVREEKGQKDLPACSLSRGKMTLGTRVCLSQNAAQNLLKKNTFRWISKNEKCKVVSQNPNG